MKNASRFSACLSIVMMIAMGFTGLSSRSFGQPESDGAAEKALKAQGFPAPPGLTHLGGGRALAPGKSITWEALASPLKPAEVIEFFRKQIGNEGYSPDGEGGTWRLPAGAPHPSRVLDVLPAGAPAPYQKLEKKPPAGTQTIIMVSRMAG